MHRNLRQMTAGSTVSSPRERKVVAERNGRAIVETNPAIEAGGLAAARQRQAEYLKALAISTWRNRTTYARWPLIVVTVLGAGSILLAAIA
jgi:hypothetical protein